MKSVWRSGRTGDALRALEVALPQTPAERARWALEMMVAGPQRIVLGLRK